MSAMSIFPLTAVLLMTGVGTASATTNGLPAYEIQRYTSRAVAHVNGRRAKQKMRIRQGVLNGSLTRREARALKREQRAIQRALRRHLRDGLIRPWESSSLNRALDYASQNIFRLRNNHRVTRFYRPPRHTMRPRPPGIARGLDDAMKPPRRKKLKRRPFSEGCGPNGIRCRRPGNGSERPPHVHPGGVHDAPELEDNLDIDDGGVIDDGTLMDDDASSGAGESESLQKPGKKKSGKKKSGKKKSGKKKSGKKKSGKKKSGKKKNKLQPVAA